MESEAELTLLAERARKLKTRARFALRVNPDVFAETHPYISTGLREHKFGIDIRAGAGDLQERGEAIAGLRRMASACTSARRFARRSRLARRWSAWRKLVRAACAGRHCDQARWMPAAAWASIITAAPGFDRGRRKVRGVCARRLKARSQGSTCKLLIEPGRFLVAQAGALVTRVLYVKRNGKKTFVITDAAMNDLIRPALYQAHHEIVPVRRGQGKRAAVDVVGPVCESGDFFARDRKLAPVKPGDLVALLDAGAYGMAQSSNYNTRPRAAEVLVEGAKARLIRRRETMADLLGPEMV